MRKFASQIYAAVRAQRLAEPLNARAVRLACPGWAAESYHVFLAKHAVGSPSGDTELFERMAPGRYRLLRR